MRIPFTKIAGDHEISSDGRTVWVNGNDGCNIGRFARAGIDIHHNHESQLRNGKQCLACKKGPTTPADWDYFVAGMKLHYGVEVEELHMPDFLRAEAA